MLLRFSGEAGKEQSSVPQSDCFIFLSSLQLFIGNQILTSERGGRHKHPHGTGKILRIFRQKIKVKRDGGQLLHSGEAVVCRFSCLLSAGISELLFRLLWQ